jgi:hypothetical protein
VRVVLRLVLFRLLSRLLRLWSWRGRRLMTAARSRLGVGRGALPLVMRWVCFWCVLR